MIDLYRYNQCENEGITPVRPSDGRMAGNKLEDVMERLKGSLLIIGFIVFVTALHAKKSEYASIPVDITVTQPTGVRLVLNEIESQINLKRPAGDKVYLVPDNGVDGYVQPKEIKGTLESVLETHFVKPYKLRPIKWDIEDVQPPDQKKDKPFAFKRGMAETYNHSIVGNRIYINSQVRADDFSFKKLSVIEETILKEERFAEYYQKIRFQCYLPGIKSFQSGRRAYLWSNQNKKKYGPRVMNAKPELTKQSYEYLRKAEEFFQKGLSYLDIIQKGIVADYRRLNNWYSQFYYYLAYNSVYLGQIQKALDYIERYLVLNANEKKTTAQKSNLEKPEQTNTIAEDYRGLLSKEEIRVDPPGAEKRTFLLDIYKLKARCYLKLVTEEELNIGVNQDREALTLYRNRLFETYKMIINEKYPGKKFAPIREQLVRKVRYLQTRPRVFRPEKRLREEQEQRKNNGGQEEKKPAAPKTAE